MFRFLMLPRWDAKNVEGVFLTTVLTANLVFALSLLGALPVQSAWAAIPTVDGKIAFSSNRDGNWEVYVMSTDGSGQTRLTDNLAIDQLTAWSPDGTKIAFTSTRDSRYQVYVMNADGSDQRNLSNSVTDDVEPAWSPDGRRIVFSSLRTLRWQICMMNVDGSAQRNLSNSDTDDSEAAWSPDGTKIVFRRYVAELGKWQIHVMNEDGSGQRNLSTGNAHDVEPAWSPDGTRIAFTTDRDGNREIYVMNEDGSGQTRLTENVASDGYPTWSPDGTKIAFSSSRDGDEEIYVMDARGEAYGLTQLTDNDAPDSFPDWQPPVQVVLATVDFDPDTLNLGSDGRWVTVYIELPADYDVAKISISSIRLQVQGNPRQLQVATDAPATIGDHDGDNIPDVMVKFNRNEVHGLFSAAGTYILVITGDFGILFKGADSVRVVQ